ncbi:TPA: methionine gamma-lyase family protein, partial [Staphylococcus pseudintermedius]
MTQLTKLIEEVETTLAPYFKDIETRAFENQARVLDAFHKVKITEADLIGSTGYGYDDYGR